MRKSARLSRISTPSDKPLKIPTDEEAAVRIRIVGTRQRSIFQGSQLDRLLLKVWKRSYGNYYADPIDECDDIENVWIFVTNIVNLEVNFGKSP